MRSKIGALAESIAVGVLFRHGVMVEARNVSVAAGELDIVGRLGTSRIAFEVRSRRGGDARDGLDEAKIRQVRRLAAHLDPPVDRIDLVGVEFHPGRVDVRWIPGV